MKPTGENLLFTFCFGGCSEAVGGGGGSGGGGGEGEWHVHGGREGLPFFYKENRLEVLTD